MKKNLILVTSDLMTKNRKAGRHENNLIRFGKRARTYLGLDNEHELEVWEDGTVDRRISRSKVLKIFHAYKEDIRRIKRTMPEEDFIRVGFVTETTFKYLCGGTKDKANIWVSDEIDEIVLGADPEFALIRNNALFYAADTELSHSGMLGHDGPLAEVRPSPEIDVDKFVSNITNILSDNRKTCAIDNFDWFAGAVYQDPTDTGRLYPIGGHIHIGTPVFVLNKLSDYLWEVFGLLNIILAKYISLPLILYETKKAAHLRRVRGRYGTLTDFRSDRKRLEHRATSGIWLIHPSLARAVLGTAKCIAEEYYKFIESENYKDSFFNYNFQELIQSGYKNNELLKYFNMQPDKLSSLKSQLNGNTTLHFIKPLIAEVNTFVKKLSSYKKYDKYVDLFIELLNRHKEIKFNPYFKNAWIYEEMLEFE